MRAYEPASFCDRWENAIAVIILLRVVAVLVLDSKGLYISMPAHKRTEFFFYKQDCSTKVLLFFLFWLLNIYTAGHFFSP